VHAHGPVDSTRALLGLGARLWARRRSEGATQSDGEEETAAEPPRRPAWDDERVREALEETVVRAAHAVRRGRWLVRLSECSLAWTERRTQRRRLLVLRGGVVAARADLPADAPAPVPPGHGRTPAERRAVFDVATFDRLRVLTTGLRALATESASIDLRLGVHARLSRRRLQAVLRCV